jgi:hypothetical protein
VTSTSSCSASATRSTRAQLFVGAHRSMCPPLLEGGPQATLFFCLWPLERGPIDPVMGRRAAVLCATTAARRIPSVMTPMRATPAPLADVCRLALSGQNDVWSMMLSFRYTFN